MTDVLIRSGNLDIEKKIRDVQAQKGRTLEDTGRQPVRIRERGLRELNTLTP